MAQSTLTPDSREEQDQYGDPARDFDLWEREMKAGSDDADSGEKKRLRGVHDADQKEAAALDPTKAVRNGERDAANPMNFEASGKHPNENKPRGIDLTSTTSPLGFIALVKRAGPLGAIIAMILLAAGAIYGTEGLLPIHLLENFSKFDSSNTAYFLRTNKMVISKISRSVTQGDCQFTGILCRFSRPSNHMLTTLADGGVEALDKKGNVISKRLLLIPNARPAAYRYTNVAKNKQITFDASQVKIAMQDDDLKEVFKSALKTPLMVNFDKVAKAWAGREGINKDDTLADKTTQEEIDKTISGETNGTISEEGGTGTPIDSSANGIEEKLSGETRTEANNLADHTFGNATGLIAGGVCMIGDVPGIIVRTARAYQLAQLVRFGALFMTTVGALKAGDAKSQEVAALGTALTAVYLGHSAMESLGVRYTLFGDTAAGSDKNYKNYQPGGSVRNMLGGVAAVLDSGVKKTLCQAATSPITGEFIDVAAGPESLGAASAINIGVGALGSIGLSAAAEYLIPLIFKAIPASVYESLGAAAFGDITSSLYMVSGAAADKPSSQNFGDILSNGLFGDTPTTTTSAAGMGGMNYGDALTSGVANAMGQLANTGGLMPLSVDDAVAYDQASQAVKVADANYDRSQRSPFDATSQNTFMGALFEKIMPMYGQLGSLSGVISSIGSIASTSTAGILGVSALAADDSEQYKMCDDPSLTDESGNQVAAGMFCNIQYGVPTKYMDMDPEQIASDLVAAGQINAQSGEAIQGADPYTVTDTIATSLGIPTGTQITSYSDWLSLCLDGSSAQATNCQIKDKQTAEYALYTIDHRIQENMDDDQPDPTEAANSDTASLVSGTKQALAQDIINSGKVSFIGDGSYYSPAQEKKIFTDIASGNTDGNSEPCGLNINILKTVDFLVKKHSSLGISDSNSRCVGYNSNRSAGSRHWDGNGSAVDIYMLDGTDLNGSNAKSIELLKEIYPMLAQGTSIHDQSQVEQLKCRSDAGDPISLPGVFQFGADCTHVHFDYPPWSDPNLQYYNGAF